MSRRKVTEKEKQGILRKVQHEFPGCRALQDIHYYRYMKEIEWQTMSPDEIVEDIKRGASEIKREIEVSIPG